MFNKNLINLPLKQFEYNKKRIPEKVSGKPLYIQALTTEQNDDELFEIIQGKIRNITIESLLTLKLPLLDFKFKAKEFIVLGLYSTPKNEIFYFGKNKLQRVVQIHERYHSIHHLMKDPNTSNIWDDFPIVDTWYKELLAQLFTYRYIMDFEPDLEYGFLELNQNQSLLYKSWKIFKHYDTKKVEELYWGIRNASKNKTLNMFKSFISEFSLQLQNNFQNQINEQLVDSLNFICLNPRVFVSELDIHQIVMNNLMQIKELNNLYETNCTIGTAKGGESPEKYKTMLIHKEYGHASLRYSRSDIVILNPAEIKTIDHPTDLKQGNHWLKPDYIFEFGTEKSANSADVFGVHLRGDLVKVDKAQKQGYIIHIQRNYYKSIDYKKDNNIKKFENYIVALKDKIAKFKSSNTFLPKVIFIVIDLGGTGRQVRGKIRIVRYPYNPDCKLSTINMNSIPKELKSLIF